MGNSVDRVNNSSNLNEFCQQVEDEFITIEAVSELKVGVTVVGVASLLVSVGSFVYFLWNKNHYIMLQKRNTLLLSLVFVSFIIAIVAATYRALTGANNFSCRLILLIFPIQFILFTEANVGRLFSLLWRVGFNNRLINETYFAMVGGELNPAVEGQRFVKKLGEEDKQESYYASILDEIHDEQPKDKEGVFRTIALWSYNCGAMFSPCLFFLLRWNPPEEVPANLQFSQFLASKLAAVLVTVVLYLLFFAIAFAEAYIFIPIGEDCYGCPLEAAFVKALIALIILTAVFYFYTLYRLRKVPDSLGIKKELLTIGLIYFFLNFVIIGILRHGAPEVEEEGKFDYSIVFMIGFAFTSFYMFAYQVWIAKANATRTVLDVEGTLVEVMKSKEGKKAFALFLASTLAFETLMFYDAAQNWKRKYEVRTAKQAHTAAVTLYDQYIGEDAFMLINISGTCRADLESNIKNEAFPKALFDRAAAEMFTLMSNDIFPRFVKSTYYRAYANEHQT